MADITKPQKLQKDGKFPQHYNASHKEMVTFGKYSDAMDEHAGYSNLYVTP